MDLHNGEFIASKRQPTLAPDSDPIILIRDNQYRLGEGLAIDGKFAGRPPPIGGRYMGGGRTGIPPRQQGW